MRYLTRKIALIIITFITITAAVIVYNNTKTCLSLNTCHSTQQDLIIIDTIADVLKYTKDVDLVVSDIDSTLITIVLKDKTGHLINWNPNLFSLMCRYSIDATLQKYLPAVMKKVHKTLIQVSDSQIRELLRSYIKIATIWDRKGLSDRYIRPATTSIPVEQKTIHVIEILKAHEIPLLLYTARSWNEQNLTEKELLQAGIAIDKNAIYHKQLIVQPEKHKERGFGFENSILYWISNKTYAGQQDESKGPILLKFFNTINYHPKKIVVIDDTKDKIEGITKLFKQQGIEATTLWYHHSAEKETKPIKELSEVELTILNIYLPKEWQYRPIDSDKAAKYIIEQLTMETIQSSKTEACLVATCLQN